jgi:hypothetical protein
MTDKSFIDVSYAPHPEAVNAPFHTYQKVGSKALSF